LLEMNLNQFRYVSKSAILQKFEAFWLFDSFRSGIECLILAF